MVVKRRNDARNELRARAKCDTCQRCCFPLTTGDRLETGIPNGLTESKLIHRHQVLFNEALNGHLCLNCSKGALNIGPLKEVWVVKKCRDNPVARQPPSPLTNDRRRPVDKVVGGIPRNMGHGTVSSFEVH